MGLTAPGLLDLKASPVRGLSRGGGARHPAGQPAPGAIFSGPCPAGPCGPGPWSWLPAMVAGGPLFLRPQPPPWPRSGPLALVHLALAVLAFYGWWADPVLPGIALALSFGLATAYSYATEGRQKLYIRAHVRPVHVRDRHQPPPGPPGKAEAGGRTPPGHPVFLRPGRLHHHLRAPGAPKPWCPCSTTTSPP